MKKSRIKDLVTGNIAEKLYQIAHSNQYPTLICLLAYAFYYVDLFLFYIFAPFALGGFSYLFYERKNYIMAVFAFFLFLCTCLFVYQKLTNRIQQKTIKTQR